MIGKKKVGLKKRIGDFNQPTSRTSYCILNRRKELDFRVFTLLLSKILSVILIRSDRLPVRFAIALLEELKKKFMRATGV